MRKTVAAGAVNQVQSWTIDLLPVVISVPEIIRDIDMAERQDDLMVRLDLGIPSDLLSIARVVRGRLTCIEYLSLRAEGRDTVTAVADLSIEELAKRLGGEEERAEAVHLISDWRQQQAVHDNT
jgi:hypothetical protein